MIDEFRQDHGLVPYNPGPQHSFPCWFGEILYEYFTTLLPVLIGTVFVLGMAVDESIYLLGTKVLVPTNRGGYESQTLVARVSFKDAEMAQ